MSDKDKINKLYWDTYNEYTIGRGDPIKGHELAMEAIEKEIRNQALEDAANLCDHLARNAEQSCGELTRRGMDQEETAFLLADTIRAHKSN